MSLSCGKWSNKPPLPHKPPLVKLILSKKAEGGLSDHLRQMFFGQFYEKWVSVRERNIKLILETATYIATTETVTCMITKETVVCTGENTTCTIVTETPTCVITIKIVTHIFAAETGTCISAGEDCNRKIH